MKRRLASGLVGAALVACAVGVGLVTPDAASQQRPFVSSADLGEEAVGARLHGTMTSVAITREVTTFDWTGTTSGRWLVAQLRLGAVKDPTSVGAQLRIGSRSWEASTRPGRAVLTSRTLAAGLPVSGYVLFEVPTDAVDELVSAGGVLRVTTSYSDRLASVLEFRLPAEQPEATDRREIPDPERAL